MTMFYARAFWGTLAYNACLSTIFFALALILGPALSQTLGVGISAAAMAIFPLWVRALVAKFFAEEMWERGAPLRRIAFNVVIAAFLGHFFLYLPLALFGAFGASTQGLAGLVVDSCFVLVASYAGILLGRKTAVST